ncbi:leucine richcontaining 34 [Angomonas deanei]|nr:leucine richcontaining 34 [Angomonas deanei]|eukprot:EPY40305.1 leucine richcontaining 34 [Angomonas deanei]
MWSDSYAAVCSDNNIEPREEIKASTGGSLKIYGNIFENFKNRLQDDEVKAIVEASCTTPVISELIFPYNSITSKGAVAIAEGLRGGMDTIISLDLSHNSIDEEGGIAIAESAQQCRSISRLLLSDNPIGGRCGPALGEMLKLLPSLVELDLYNTDLDMKALVYMAQGLQETQSLRTLNIGKPLLTNPDDINYVVHHLSIAIQRNKTIQHLTMSHFGLTDSHLETLLMPICGSNVIHLSLKGNKLSQDSGSLLAKMLERKDKLQFLDASFNRLRDKGGIAMAPSVKNHNSLKSLVLNNNGMGTPGISSIVSAVCDCPSLTSLLLWGNDFSDGIAKEIYDAKDRLEELEECDFALYMVGEEPSVYRK